SLQTLRRHGKPRTELLLRLRIPATDSGGHVPAGDMKASSRLKIISAICALAAAGLIGYALWLVVPQLVLMSRTKQIAAEVVNKDDPTGKYRRMRQGPALLPQIIRAHDESGYSIYGLKFTFLYFLNGQTYIADTETPYRTRDVAGILEL